MKALSPSRTMSPMEPQRSVTTTGSPHAMASLMTAPRGLRAAEVVLAGVALQGLAEHAVAHEDDGGAATVPHPLERLQQRERILPLHELRGEEEDDGVLGDAVLRAQLRLRHAAAAREALVVDGPRQEKKAPRVSAVVAVVVGVEDARGHEAGGEGEEHAHEPRPNARPRRILRRRKARVAVEEEGDAEEP